MRLEKVVGGGATDYRHDPFFADNELVAVYDRSSTGMSIGDRLEAGDAVHEGAQTHPRASGYIERVSHGFRCRNHAKLHSAPICSGPISKNPWRSGRRRVLTGYTRSTLLGGLEQWQNESGLTLIQAKAGMGGERQTAVVAGSPPDRDRSSGHELAARHAEPKGVDCEQCAYWAPFMKAAYPPTPKRVRYSSDMCESGDAQ